MSDSMEGTGDIETDKNLTHALKMLMLAREKKTGKQIIVKQCDRSCDIVTRSLDESTQETLFLSGKVS